MPIIAKVRLLLLDGDKRVEIPPGNEVPADKLAAHDKRELLESGAVEDTDATAAIAKAGKKAVEVGAKEFEAARQRVADANESIKPLAETKKEG
ncbi:MAG: hypothetical protein WC091_01200 [Sulfuricellaceae bacterium]